MIKYVPRNLQNDGMIQLDEVRHYPILHLEPYVKLKDFEQQLATVTAERDALAEWKKIVLGTGTDQEAVIRMAAAEYTQIAVQTWRDKVTQLERELAQAREERDTWKARTWTDVVQFIADSKENLLQQYCNLQIMYGEQKHRIRDLEKELAQAREREGMLRDSIEEAVRYCEKDYGGVVIGKVLEEALKETKS